MQIKNQSSYEILSKYRNALMGLQIILIIFFHFAEDCKAYDVRFSGLIYLFYKYIRSSGVDMFLLLSGIGLYFSWKKRSEKKKFYKKRYSRILIPYCIVAIPTWIWIDIIYLGKGWDGFVRDFLFLTFFYERTRLFWYVLMIGICYWIFPYIFEVIETASDRISEKMRVLTLCMLSIVFLIMMQQYHPELYGNISIAVSRIPAFLIGTLLGKAVYEKRGLSGKHVCITVALAVMLAWPLKMAGTKILGVYTYAFLNYALSLCFVFCLQYLSENRNKVIRNFHQILVSIFEWFGKYTLELYLIHVSVRRIMKSVGYPTYRLAYEGLMVMISIALAVFLNKFTESIKKRIK